MKDKRNLVFLLLVLSLILVTTGVTVAFFTYNATGQTLNTITTGGITFHYKELKGKGRGISITDALPVSSNEEAKESNNYFDFKITSTTQDGVTIPYTVTARMSNNSDIILGNIINVYLTENDQATDLFKNQLPKFNELESYGGNEKEKIIYTDTVEVSSYEKNFKFRMWIDENTNLNTGNGTSDYNNKQFSVTINVYANGALASNNSKICRFVDGTFGEEGEVGAKYLCDPGDGIERYFYIIKVDGDNVSLITEENITQENNTKTLSYNDALNYFDSGDGVAIKNSWTKVKSIELPGALDISRAVGNNNFNLTTSSSSAWYFITPSGVNTYPQSPSANASNLSSKRWLFNYTSGCTNYGCDSETDLGSSSTVTGYWTKDLDTTGSSAWLINNLGMLAPYPTTTSNAYGVRPVINVNKNAIATVNNDADDDDDDDDNNPNSDDDQSECVTNGYYKLQCSCDNRTIAWQNDYFDSSNNLMDKTKFLDSTYPPANTYKCFCGNQEGYVVNTGEEVGKICREDEQLNPSTLRAKIITAGGGRETIASRDVTTTVDNLLASKDNDGTTYYFNGNINNNWVSFAGFDWRVMRINGDGSIRMIMQRAIPNAEVDPETYSLHSSNNPAGSNNPSDNIDYLYYRNMSSKTVVDNWYQTNIDKSIPNFNTKKYSDYVVTGKYCEAVKVGLKSEYVETANQVGYNMVTYSNSYKPSFKCVEDPKGHQYLNSDVALITIDEALLAGSKVDSDANNFLQNKPYGSNFAYYWTMSSMGFSGGDPAGWMAISGGFGYQSISSNSALRPVINLNKNVISTIGTGTEIDPYFVDFNYD